MAQREGTNIGMSLITYATSSNILADEKRQRRTTSAEYFTKKSVNVRTDKDKQAEIGLTDEFCVPEIKETSTIEKIRDGLEEG